MIMELVHENSIDVQLFALQTIAAIKPSELFTNEELRLYVLSLCEQNTPLVSIGASFLCIVYDNETASAQAALEKWLCHKNPSYRHLAAAACAHTGARG